MSEASPQPEVTLLSQLEPTAVALFDRHMSTAKEWFGHEMVPWGLGQDFEPQNDGYIPPTLDELKLTMPLAELAVQRSLFLNLLTEDNLPHYYARIDAKFGNEDIWGEWNRRWTAEEGRHAIVMRDYLNVMRFPGIDLRLLERARMRQVGNGKVPDPEDIEDGLVYVALQELATRISHWNTGALLKDEPGQAVMKRVGADENLHHLFYRDLVTAAIEIDPSGMVAAIDRQVTNFEMPGTDVETYEQDARLIRAVGIYGLTEFRDKVVVPTLTKHWNFWDIPDLNDGAKRARDNTDDFLKRLGVGVERERRLRERFQAAA